jgi:hypothetical protein
MGTFLTVAIILMALGWLIGYLLMGIGGAIHVLLVGAIALALFALMTSGRDVPPKDEKFKPQRRDNDSGRYTK